MQWKLTILNLLFKLYWVSEHIKMRFFFPHTIIILSQWTVHHGALSVKRGVSIKTKVAVC